MDVTDSHASVAAAERNRPLWLRLEGDPLADQEDIVAAEEALRALGLRAVDGSVLVDDGLRISD